MDELTGRVVDADLEQFRRWWERARLAEKDEAQLTVESGDSEKRQTLGRDSGPVDDKVEGYYPPAFVRWRTTSEGLMTTPRFRSALDSNVQTFDACFPYCRSPPK